mgnify:CR=1 FL=1
MINPVLETGFILSIPNIHIIKILRKDIVYFAS